MILSFLLLLLSGLAHAQPTEVRFFTGEGEQVSFAALVDGVSDAEVVFFGEIHGDSLGHRVQHALLEALHSRYAGRMILSLEQFEADVQLMLDEFLAGHITESHFLQSTRPWNNYRRDYHSMVLFAKANAFPVVAANAPRRYVNRVSRLGLTAAMDSLFADALGWLAPMPLPAPSAGYRARWDALMGGAGSPHMGPDRIQRMFEAQWLWDATMAYRLAFALNQRDRAVALHLAGSFHVDRHQGTPEALQHYRPGTRARVVVMRPVAHPDQFPDDLHGIGDFVVLTQAPPVEE